MTSYLSRNVYPAVDGSSASFAISWPYILPAHVHVYERATPTSPAVEVAPSAFTFTSGSVIHFNTPPTAGLQVEIWRQTPRDALVALIQPGAVTSAQLNAVSTQLLYIVEEVSDEQSGVSQAAIAAATAAALSTLASAIFTVTTGAGFNAVTSRALLTSLTSMVGGQFAYLGEAAQEGILQFIAGNQTALITGDPDKALFMAGNAVSSGASGAFARPRSHREYKALWWLGNGTTWTDADVPLQRALNTIEPGSILHMPRAGVAEVSGPLITKAAGVTIEGAGNQFSLSHKASVAAFNVLQVAGSGTRVRALSVIGKYGDAPAGNPACIIVSTNAAYLSSQPLDDVEIVDCRLTQSSLPVVVFGQVASNDSVVVAPTNVRLLRNFLGTDYQGLSIFGADDVLVEGNHIQYLIAPINVTNAEGARILGSHRVNFKNNYLDSSLGIGASDHAALRLSGAMLGTPNYTRRQNTDIRISDNYTTGFNHGIIFDECLGDLDITHNKFIFDRARTDVNFGIGAGAVGQTFGGISTSVDRMIARHNLFYGVSMGIDYFGPGKQMSFTDNRVVCNARTTNDATAIAGRTQFGGFKLNEFLRNRFYAPFDITSQFYGLQLLGSAGETYIIRDNWIGETSSSPGTPGNIGWDNSGHAGNYYGGNNACYPVGTYANIIS